MKCEQIECIYNKLCECVLKEITLDNIGMCEECIRVSIPTTQLKELKKELIEKIRQR